MRQFSRIVARNSAFGFASQIIIKILSFGFTILIVRNLGAESYGQYAGVLAFGALFVFLGDLGLSPYLVREVARLRDKPDGADRIQTLYGDVLALRMVLSVLAAFLLILTAWLTGRSIVMVGAIALGTLGLMMYGVQGTSDAILAGYERLDLSAYAKILNQITFVTLGAIALLLNTGYYGLILANLLGVGLMSYICWHNVKVLGVRPHHFTPKNWLVLLKASWPFGLITFALGLSYKFDSVLLNIFWGDADTGYYNAAYNLIFSATMLSNVLNTALYPSLARQSVNASHSLPKIYERAFRYLMVLALPIAVGVFALADLLVPFLFKSTYQPSVAILQILILVVPFMFASEFLGYVVVIAGKERQVARSVLISTGFNVSFNLVIVPTFGLTGAAIMTVATEMILVTQYLWILSPMLKTLNWGQMLWRPLLAALLMGGLVFSLHSLPLILNIIIGGLVYLSLLLVSRVVGRDEVSFIRSLRKREEVSVAG
jgi:O-antigen/teichoic acid export membrane protein